MIGKYGTRQSVSHSLERSLIDNAGIWAELAAWDRASDEALAAFDRLAAHFVGVGQAELEADIEAAIKEVRNQ